MSWFSAWIRYCFVDKRFSVVIYISSLLLYLTVYFASLKLQANSTPFHPKQFLSLFIGYLWIISVLYHLRVFDDYKDRAADQIAYPERTLSKGLLSFRSLMISGVVAILLETLVALYFGRIVFLCHSATLLYTILMLKEFFLSSWLKKHLFFYGFLHNIILIFIGFTVLQMAGPPNQWLYQSHYLSFIFLIPVLIFPQEMARKIRLPEKEQKEIDTYSKSFGLQKATYVIHFLQLAGLIYCYLFLKPTFGLPLWFFIISFIAWLLATLLFQIQLPTLNETQSIKLVGIAFIFSFTFCFSFLLHLLSPFFFS